ncbi:DUF3551 domain-containing protein [Bradyrhizobium sp. CCGUVB1N3]|uniref:DUF3551 domain-containing protein n=1 Tax=Bradyrhizobium sp. CCGUVB1N3 TaxID=2949629 RepID=UPI0020B4577B|nr:DUF3551 domain-containing protein [Bradyrhizobium sp. CCGUVB1N3]MCP3473250.1 DUF3551 domain-containing protein [Bradyrhizobium sp. CCGUVB1N3]
MRMLHSMILAGTMVLAVAPVEAQRYDPRYPVCLQSWHEHGITFFDCSYISIDQCRATASGLNAMCLENPYWQRWQALSSRRQGRDY